MKCTRSSKRKLSAYREELDGLLESELPAFNQSLDENHLPRIVPGGSTATPSSD